jgi:tRNA dimethylallyltransferase
MQQTYTKQEAFREYDPNKHVLFIIGPTASGKTDLGIEIATQYNKAVISADSRQIYLDMDIGTAKAGIRPNKPENAQDLWQQPIQVEDIDHYMVDILKPDQRYTAFDFKKQAYDLIQKLGNPIIVGGTGLYIDVLLHNYELQAQGENESQEIRSRLVKKFEEIVQKSCESDAKQKMWEKLQEVDPDTASEIHPNNWRYVCRALELYELTGESKTKVATKRKPPFEPYIVGIHWDRAKLYERIELRIDMQMDEGLLQETKHLLDKYDHNLPALTSLGYLELKDHLEGNTDLDEAVRIFKQNTRRFAKRQIGWFRRYKDMKWINSDSLKKNSGL